jgi:acyl-CoA synthetase (AMP-forming)/AMP-acid ligase II
MNSTKLAMRRSSSAAAAFEDYLRAPSPADQCHAGGCVLWPARRNAPTTGGPTTPDAGPAGSLQSGPRTLASPMGADDGQLAVYKLPTSVEIIAAIPKTGAGKIRGVGLRDRAAAKEE